jgi:hypothetical protein
MQIKLLRKKPGVGLSSLMFLALLGMSVAYCISIYQTKIIWFGIAACTISFGGFLHSIWKHEILVQIDETGIYDRRLGIGKIMWSDVENVHLQLTEENRFLCFRVRDPKPYLARLKGGERERMLFHRSLGFSGFNVDIGALDVNILDLKKQIDVRVKQH